jgi:predicted nucleic acid-binding protein
MILIDTNIYVAYLNQRDQNNQRARTLVRKMLSGEFGLRFTISEVFSEVTTVLFRKTKNLEIVKRAWNLMYSTDKAWGHSIIVTKDHIDSAWKVYQSYVTPKRPFSFVDCLLIAIAQANNISQIMSFDQEFDGVLTRIH